MDALAETLKNNPNLTILVEGHTDDDQMVAGASYTDNWDLSVARATSVVRRLIRSGVNAAQLSVVGRGETAPVASNDNDEGKAQNRRTAIKADPNLVELLKNNN